MAEDTESEAGPFPADVDLSKPNAARVYDYYLGGCCNFEVDRDFAKRVVELMPQVPELARINRAFLRRAVLECARAGIRQFLDIGSGIPTADSTHYIAKRVQRDTRVVYVDNEPVAVAHSRLAIEGDPNVAIVQADLREPDAVLGARETTGLLDMNQPIAVLMVSILPFVLDADRPVELIGRYRDAIASSSRLVISQITNENLPTEMSTILELYKCSATPVAVRKHAAVVEFFSGFELLEPGVVFAPQWRPEEPEDVGAHPERSAYYAGVGHKP